MFFFDDFYLLTDRLLLKALDPAYAAKIADYFQRNKNFFMSCLPGIEKFLSDDRLQYERLWKEYELMLDSKAIRFFLFDRDDHKFENILGDISIANIIRGSVLSCTLAYNLDFIHTGKGLMSEALEKIIDFIFTDLKLHKIEAFIQLDNKPSLKLIHNLNFEREGTSRDYMFINGEWINHERYVLVNKD